MRFKVISIHFTNDCNMNCPFCYVKKLKTRSNKFWFELIPYLKKLAPQVALGGGEPFTKIPFIKEFSKRCKKHKLLCNVTTNGRLLMELNDDELKETLKDITMVSVSWDNFKVQTDMDRARYFMLVKRIKKLTKCQVGCNLLIDKDIKLVPLTDYLFSFVGVDRVFALYPKNMPKVDILEMKKEYFYLSAKHEHFYIDDATKMIIENNSYDNWKTPCHYFRDMVSISQDGTVKGCSFDDESLLKINKPKDILKIKEVKADERYKCPYIKP